MITGKLITAINADGDVDDIFYNAVSREIYLSCGDGYVDIFKQADSNTYSLIEKNSSRAGARTSLFIPQLKQLIVASPFHPGRNAELLIYSTK